MRFELSASCVGLAKTRQRKLPIGQERKLTRVAKSRVPFWLEFKSKLCPESIRLCLGYSGILLSSDDFC